MQNPIKPTDLVNTDGKVRLSVSGASAELKETTASTGTDLGLEQSSLFHGERLVNTGTSTQNDSASETHSNTQSDTRAKTQSGELSSLEHAHDPDGTMGCNTCQEDLEDAIKEHCQIKIGDVIASRYEIRKYLGEISG